MKKALKADQILSELKAGSVFFREQSPKPVEGEKSSGDEKTERVTDRTEFRTDQRTEIRTVELPIKRRTKRYSFEFYEDQIAELKKMKIEAEMEGESLTLSDIARSAFDLYLSKRQGSEK